jgi:DNA-binding transcriptional ArsR family regulator
MAKARTPETLVLSAAQTDALISPPRLEIVEGLSVLGRASARDLAAHLGRSPGSVYHHLSTLRHAGLINEVARRPGRRRPEGVFALAAPTLAVAADSRSGSAARMIRTLKAVLRQAARDVESALAVGPAEMVGRFHGLQLSAALDPAEVRTVLSFLQRVERLFRRASRRPRRQAIYRWTSVFVPIERRRS